MIEQKQVYAVEFQNFRRVHRNRADGELFAVEIEVCESDWHHLADFPRDAIGNAAIQWIERNGGDELPANGKPKREAKPKPERGKFGKFWELLHSFHNRPDVRRWLGFDVGYADEKAAVAALYRIFNVTSRTFISPDDLRAWVARMPEPDGALTVIELAKAKVVG